jgi:hypothetical protein
MFSMMRVPNLWMALVLAGCGAATKPSTSDRTIVRQVVDEDATVTVTRVEEPRMQPAALTPANGGRAECPPEGVRVSSVPTDDGVRVDFTARTDLVPRLRKLVSRLADQQNRGLTAESAAESASGLFGVHGTAAAVEAPGGASLLLKPTDPDELEAFRDQVMQVVDALSSGRLDPCPLPPP